MEVLKKEKQTNNYIDTRLLTDSMVFFIFFLMEILLIITNFKYNLIRKYDSTTTL